MEQVDVVVVGAGVVGLAIARAFALRGREVLVLEREAGIGMGTSSRNSEVIHAGIYYLPGSLKARLCVQGKQMLYRYCQERRIPHQQCGKLIVALTDSQRMALPDLVRQGAINGVDDLVVISREEAMALEPSLACMGAVKSPSTGIIDSHSLMLAFQGDLEHKGGLVVCHTPVSGLRALDGGLEVGCADGTLLRANCVINSAGLGGWNLALQTHGLPASFVPGAWYAKGSYFTLEGRSPFKQLIYPAPEPDRHLAGLGVHLTIDLGGQAKFGPDVQWTTSADDLDVDAAQGERFYVEVRKYWPGLPDGALHPGYAGMRPKISGPGQPAADFLIQGPETHGVPGLINLFGIESPGLTSCMALAEHVTHLA
ncbi:NAD(P)/FAD-dependent oxidoreductase [Hydrogenophaga sp.]|uniref:NAD(P)/FAD-dependent oxidoreductase n=1 Tax=Hydrogenophaga sp. TaxID=1904254 RepID=UPI002717CC73|nr:NAD(P)/FAD-dependent oxidoreductase [Hydrogenophaga sp.]MDO8904620.1 NAD(P)/FAD-dependent oxidoreductase [Hydrogenophaga sp.]